MRSWDPRGRASCCSHPGFSSDPPFMLGPVAGAATPELTPCSASGSCRHGPLLERDWQEGRAAPRQLSVPRPLAVTSALWVLHHSQGTCHPPCPCPPSFDCQPLLFCPVSDASGNVGLPAGPLCPLWVSLLCSPSNHGLCHRESSVQMTVGFCVWPGPSLLHLVSPQTQVSQRQLTPGPGVCADRQTDMTYTHRSSWSLPGIQLQRVGWTGAPAPREPAQESQGMGSRPGCRVDPTD